MLKNAFEQYLLLPLTYYGRVCHLFQTVLCQTYLFLKIGYAYKSFLVLATSLNNISTYPRTKPGETIFTRSTTDRFTRSIVLLKKIPINTYIEMSYENWLRRYMGISIISRIKTT